MSRDFILLKAYKASGDNSHGPLGLVVKTVRGMTTDMQLGMNCQ